MRRSRPKSQQVRSYKLRVERWEAALKMKRRHWSDEGGRRALGGSWYLRIMEVFATVFVSAARRPVGA